MVHEVIAVAHDTSLSAVARLLALHRISAVPVIDDGGRPIGVVSQHDLVSDERPRSTRTGRSVYYRIWSGDICAEGMFTGPLNSRTGIAADVMSSPLVVIAEESKVEAAARRMLETHVHRLFVVRANKVVGIITALDCMRAMLPSSEQAALS